MSKLYIVSGVPGCGSATFAINLVKYFVINGHKCVTNINTGILRDKYDLLTNVEDFKKYLLRKNVVFIIYVPILDDLHPDIFRIAQSIKNLKYITLSKSKNKFILELTDFKDSCNNFVVSGINSYDLFARCILDNNL